MASGGENYGYSGKDNSTTEVSSWSNGNSVGNISNNGVGNGDKISAQSAQERHSAPVPSPSRGVHPSSGGNYRYNESGDSNKNSVANIGNISNTGIGYCNKISAQSTQEQQPAPVPSPRSGVQPSGGGNYGYSASGKNKISVAGWSRENSVKNTTGWSNGSSVGNISNAGAENANKISAQSAQEQQPAPAPFPGSGVQPSGGGNYGYSASGKNKINVSGRSDGNSVGSIVTSSTLELEKVKKISAQSAPVPSVRIGVQPSSGGNYQVGNNGNISNTNSGVRDSNKTLAQSAQERQSVPVPSPWSGVEPSGGGSYGYRADHDNNMSVSGWSNGNSVGNIRNTGVGTNNSESTPRRSCCSCLICS